MDHNGRKRDLSRIAERDAAEYEIKDDNGEGLGIYFMLAGPEHPRRREMRLDRERSVRARLANMKTLHVGKVLAAVDDVEEEAWRSEFLAACTLGWRDLEIDGKAVPFSPETARSLYADKRWAFLRRQLLGALDAAENFRESSPTT